jgi:hypothetical protein
MLLNSAVFLLSVALTTGQATSNRHRHRASALRTHSDSKARATTELSKLIKNLRAKGATVVLTDEKISQPFFSSKARIININGEGVQVFDYAHASVLQREAKRVSPDGMTVGTSKPSWMAPPHFFKSGKLIVLYVGANESVLKVLKTSLGSQLAGG